MATAQIRPDWTIGTLNLTAGVVEFTTTDSMLETAAIQAGDSLITESGLVLIIADITGQNAGTLMEPCPAGAAGMGQPLRIRFQPDGSRYNGATADLVQLLGSGNVYEFAGLDGTGGGVPVFTGAGTMELGDYVADDNGNLGELASLVLAANKILRTDASGNASQGDLTNAAAALLALAGAADQLPYFSGSNTAALTALTAAGRAGINTAGAAEANQLPYLTSSTASALTPLTAKGRAVIGASSNDAVLAEIMAPPRPATSGRGLFASFQTSSGGAAILPAGGTYAFWLVAYEAASGQFRNGFSAGVSAGGSTVGTAVSGWIWSGVYWNLT